MERMHTTLCRNIYSHIAINLSSASRRQTLGHERTLAYPMGPTRSSRTFLSAEARSPTLGVCSRRDLAATTSILVLTPRPPSSDSRKFLHFLLKPLALDPERDGRDAAAECGCVHRTHIWQVRIRGQWELVGPGVNHTQPATREAYRTLPHAPTSTSTPPGWLVCLLTLAAWLLPASLLRFASS